jgi:hypothetical protein
MIDIKNALHLIDDMVVLPVVTIAFLLLTYVVIYLNRKDPDVVRARIFLNYNKFKNAFILLAALAFVLVFHVAFIYIPSLFLIEDSFLMKDLQFFFGLMMAIIPISFVFLFYRSLK